MIYKKIPVKWGFLLTPLAIIISALLNGLFFLINEALSLPLFLDSIFTVMTAALFGLVPGLLTGLLSNLFFEVLSGFPGYLYPFAIVSMFTAWATAYMVKKEQLTTTVGAIWTILVLTLGNSLLGALIVSFLIGGTTDLMADNIVKSIMIAGQSLFTSAFFARILINFVDKGIAVLLAYIAYNSIRNSLQNQKAIPE